MKNRLILRADASSELGVGHVMRCLALAQAWQDAGGTAVFACAELPTALAARLRREGCEFVAVGPGPDDLARMLDGGRGSWVVVDGYSFAPELYEHLRNAGAHVLALDDMAHLERYPVDVLLNQNLSATPSMYAGKTDETTQLLLGPRYCLLRREFRATTMRRRSAANRSRRVLVSFGGGDAPNLTAFVLKKLMAARADYEVLVLAGAANPHVAGLRALAATATFPCEIRVNAENVAECMTWADVAITAAGSTVWEMASVRLPALVAAIEDNQIAGVRALASIPFFRTGLVEDLAGWNLHREIDNLLRLAATAEPVAIDAHGATRVVEAMLRPKVASPQLAFS